MSKIIAVVGATGTQGGSVARTFAALPDWQVRGITRNPDSAAAKELAALGVTVVKADLDDVASLQKAFTGAQAIFGVTDFWQFPEKASTQEMVKTEGITWDEACYRQELQHGKTIVDAAARVVGEGVLDRFVYSSLSDAKKASKGKYSWVYHFDSKAHVLDYLKEKAKEQPTYKALSEKTSDVQIGFYLDNWSKNPILTPKKTAEGKYAFCDIADTSLPESAARPIPWVHPPTDTGPFVEALVLRAPAGTTLLGTSEQTSFADYVKQWEKVVKMPAEHHVMNLQKMEEIAPGGLGREVGEKGYYVREYGWDGGEGAVLPKDAGVDMEKLTTVEKYLRQADWSSVIG